MASCGVAGREANGEWSARVDLYADEGQSEIEVEGMEQRVKSI